MRLPCSGPPTPLTAAEFFRKWMENPPVVNNISQAGLASIPAPRPPTNRIFPVTPVFRWVGLLGLVVYPAAVLASYSNFFRDSDGTLPDFAGGPLLFRSAGAIMTAASAWLVLYSFRGRVELSQEFLIVHGVLGIREMKLADVTRVAWRPLNLRPWRPCDPRQNPGYTMTKVLLYSPAGKVTIDLLNYCGHRKLVQALSARRP